MSLVQIHDKKFELFISKKELESIVDQMAKKMESLQSQAPIFIVVLNGSFFFASDLLKALKFDSEVDFIKVKSYQGMESSGKMSLSLDISADISNRTVVIIEDIVDTGRTADRIFEYLKEKNPMSIEMCTLLYKSDAFEGIEEPKYVGFKIPNKFVVGYGLDYDEAGRNLNEIYQLKE